MREYTTKEFMRIGVGASAFGYRAVSLPGGAVGLVADEEAAGEQLTMFVRVWAASWHKLAFPIVTMTHKFAAALMCTSCPGDEMGEIKPPWSSYMVLVPDGLVRIQNVDGELESVTRVLVMFAFGRWFYSALGHTVAVHQWNRDAKYFAVEKRDESMMSGSLEFTKRDERANIAISRLLMNSVLAMSDPASVKKLGKHQRRSEQTLGEGVECIQTALMYAVGKPVRIDCREPLRSFMAGERRAPNVRFLVRGHWTHQVHGAGRMERRLQWIEPYWKGDETLPTLVRSHALSDRLGG